MGRVIENGLTSDSSADSFVTSDMIITGSVYWVDSVTGSVSGPGSYEAPYATLDQAVGAATAANGDVIIIKSGHTESVGSAITINKAGLKIFGIGSGSSAPNFTCTANVDAIDITAAEVEITNLYFPIGTTANNTSRINIGAAGCKIKSCTFLCGVRDIETITVPDTGDYARIESCAFTVSADGPTSGIRIESATSVGVRIESCSFNGGSYSWDNGAIYSAVAHTGFQYVGNTLTNRADIVHTAAAKGWCVGTIAGDDCHVVGIS